MAAKTGFVISFLDNKGYGFIRPDVKVPNEKDLFVHRSEIQSDGYRPSLQKDQHVKYSVGYKNGKQQALNVTAADGSKFSVGLDDSVRRSGFRGNGNGVKCHNCGGIGHIARNCSSDVLRPGACYSCGLLGHVARDCNWNSNGSGVRGNSRSDRAAGNKSGGGEVTA